MFSSFALIIILLGMHPKEIIRDENKELYTTMFTAVLFLIAKKLPLPN